MSTDNREALRLHAEARGYKPAVDVPHAVMRTDIDMYGKKGRVVTVKWSRNHRVLDVLVDHKRPLKDPDHGNYGLMYQGIKGAFEALS